MTSERRRMIDGERGYALVSIVIFLLVITISGVAFFAMASRESKGALYREASSEAFLIADGAVERVRAKFLEDRTWRTGWMNESVGRGTYDVALTDTTFDGEPDVVQIITTGRVENAIRKIEVMAKVPPTGFGVGILIVGDADVNGNLCLLGDIHVNGDSDFGPNDVHLKCGGEITAGFDIEPQMMFTEPDRYPDATYYYVRGNKIGSDYQARIYDRDGVDITTALGDSLEDVTSYNNGSKAFEFDFDSDALLEKYFNDSTGVFRRLPGDQSVIVNFGETPIVDPPGVDGVAEVTLDGGGTSINATIINTRFIGTTEAQRLESVFWEGGLTLVKQVTMEPYSGIALITHDFQKSGGAGALLGTDAWPAYVYVTQDVVDANANLEITGAITCLRDFNTTGGPDVTFDDGFLEQFPGWLIEEWLPGVSGTLRVLSWRELASGS
jgi:hypothetical protein